MPSKRLFICVLFCAICCGAFAKDKIKSHKDFFASEPKRTASMDVHVGDRVPFEKDTANHSHPTAVDAKTWKKVSIKGEQRWNDGTVHSMEIETLVSPVWIESHEIKVGKNISLTEDFESLALDENIHARITKIENCPKIATGSGRVVLTTVDHLDRGTGELTFVTDDGKTETVVIDGNHNVFSNDRNESVHAAVLRKGEKIKGHEGAELRVESTKHSDKTEKVRRINLEDEHVNSGERVQPKSRNSVVIPERFWSPGPQGDREQNAARHFRDHGRDFPQANNVDEYVHCAYEFIAKAPMKKTRPGSGDVVYFDPKTNYFAVTDRHGTMKTFFKPSGGLSYYNRQ